MTSGGAAIGSVTNPGSIYINGDLNLAGGVALHGDVYVAGNLNISNGSINNGNVYVQGYGELSNGTIPGDIYISGNTKIVNATLSGTVYSGGNLTLGWEPKGTFYVHYMGTLAHPGSFNTTILSRIKKVSSIPSIPTFEIPDYNITLKDDQWYADRGYLVKAGNVSINVIPNNYKLVVANNFNSIHHTSPAGNVIIISKNGDISIKGWRDVTGILIAPEGRVDFEGASFTGIVITKEGFFYTQGGSTLKAKELGDFFPDPSDIPFIVDGIGAGDSLITYEDLIKHLYPIREK
ncbi:MAG TPA: hypothetical protein DHM90_08935 [Clostridiaceae bacterium]|nr:hypothetical protein [Clostridiaceae bacterium]